ncbi:OsmC family protein [Actinomadura bangladeshensis]|uniref:OsmC family peroxiredoxin n=1 Tax=Actinomadura bangladeshensis TaxID=453573 RepID=A0A4R4P9U7_9ACTN|nr:OsmC family protein [Actinomadura bangladeshensis]TDC17022.1 OsmC family peroxiredoxin [Actinomadura bangladeshensis]
MSEMLVVHQDDDAFAVLVRDHVLHVDQPYSAGGMDGGLTPVELFVASLAACAAHSARRHLVRHCLPAEGLEVTADFAMNGDVPARVSQIVLWLRPRIPVPDEAVDGLRRAVEMCAVRNSIFNAPRIGVHVETASKAA